MSYIDELKKALDKFDRCMDTKVETIRRYKNEIQTMTEAMYETSRQGHYISDPERIIISAPEILIGNLSQEGVLLGDGGSVVVVRGNTVSLEGTGSADEGGNLIMRASSIRQTAVDPGRDGLENVVSDERSEILSQAKSISLRSDDVTGSFVESPTGGSSGISVHSDTYLTVEATPSNRSRKSEITRKNKEIDDAVSSLSDSSKKYRDVIDGILAQIESLGSDQTKILDSESNYRANYQDASALQNALAALQSSLCSAVASYVSSISERMDLERRKDDYNRMKKELDENKSTFQTETTGSSVKVLSERIFLVNADGDSNMRENEDAVIGLYSPHLSLCSQNLKGEMTADSTLEINSQNISVSTANTKLDKNKSGSKEAIGDLTVTSKNVTVRSVDEEVKKGEVKEKALTKGGVISVRAENISAQATDTEGKSTGQINLNAKSIQVASMDVDKDKRTDKEMASSSQMVLLSEKMFTGSLDGNNKSKLVQIASSKVAISGDDTAEMQQGDGKAVVTLDGGKFTAGGSKNEFQGDTVINGGADIKGDVEAPNGKFKGVEASGKFKSANISDGLMGGMAAAAGKPSAKIKLEEAQKQKSSTDTNE